jgi:hypothetical protein
MGLWRLNSRAAAVGASRGAVSLVRAAQHLFGSKARALHVHMAVLQSMLCCMLHH